MKTLPVCLCPLSSPLIVLSVLHLRCPSMAASVSALRGLPVGWERRSLSPRPASVEGGRPPGPRKLRPRRRQVAVSSEAGGPELWALGGQRAPFLPDGAPARVGTRRAGVNPAAARTAGQKARALGLSRRRLQSAGAGALLPAEAAGGRPARGAGRPAGGPRRAGRAGGCRSGAGQTAAA